MTGNSEPWGRLTRQEVYDCFPTGTLPAGLRTWAQLRPAIRRLPTEAQTHLRQVAEAKERVSKQNKRDADARAQAKRQAAWRERRKVDQPASEDGFSTVFRQIFVPAYRGGEPQSCRHFYRFHG